MGLRQRIGAIILLHALLVYATMLLFARIGQPPDDRLYILPQPDRVAAIVLAFERAPPDTYPDLVMAFRDDRQQVRLLPVLPPPVMPEPGEAEAGDLTKAPFRTALAGRPFRIEAQDGNVLRAFDRQPYFSQTPVRVIVGLPNGRAVAISRFTTAPVARFIRRFWWFGLAIALLDLFVIGWLAAQSTGPVERLARAVRTDDMTQLRVRGAREFVELGEAFRAMRARLDTALEERTRIIAAVAHDFRTYLTRLELRSDFITDERQRALALRDLDQMCQLMDDALIFARPDGGGGGEGSRADDADAATDIAAALERIVAVRRDSGEDVTLQLADRPCAARVTAAAFERMVANLLDNAVRYGRGPVSIHIGARGGEWLVYIDDHGPGVPEAQLPELTEPFFRLETSRARHTGGVGLGLSIVQALAHRFGGTLELRNRSEGGLRACLSLARLPGTGPAMPDRSTGPI